MRIKKLNKKEREQMNEVRLAMIMSILPFVLTYIWIKEMWNNFKFNL